MFRKLSKKVVEYTIKPFILWYLKKERRFSYEGLEMRVMPGVFHPLLFFSTKIMANYLKKLSLNGATFLEPGCGSGMISLLAAKAGAQVTALDINQTAVENTLLNAKINDLKINVLYSNLFEKLPPQIFDFIFINPPYYPKKATDESEFAWFCGEHFEYFHQLFSSLPSYYNANSHVVMILSEDCDLKSIQNVAATYHQELVILEFHRGIFEKNYLFKIKLKVV